MKKGKSLKMFESLSKLELENVVSGKLSYKSPVVVDFTLNSANTTCSTGTPCNTGIYNETIRCTVGNICGTGTVVLE